MRLRPRALTVIAAVAFLAAVAPAGAATPPGFTNHQAPAPLGRDAGEPSIGVNDVSGATLFQAGLQTLKVDFSGPTTTWEDVSSPLTNKETLDPILFTDHATGRTFVSQLYGVCSLMAFSDDDGKTWTNNPLGCGAGSLVDHQTLGGGPFHAGTLQPVGAYPHAVYYCAQAIVSAQCSLSPAGGLAFGPGVPIYDLTRCGGLHGHLKTAPDGTVYVPNADCGGKAAVVRSADNGLTWTIDAVPDSSTQDESDPSVGLGQDGTAYLGYQGKDGHAYVATKPPGAGAWTKSVDVGAGLGLQNIQFPAVVAGDGDRAAVAFHGTTTAGDDQAASFAGVWHLYVASTYDRGATWSTVDATPSDPVQKGCIWLGGGSNPCRNLLDFMDATADKQGRILVAYADGCTGACATGGANTRTAIATIARQSAGTGVRAAYDGTLG